jgi:phosphoribosylaminoimidazole-succinocarboxamide synthase
MMTNHVLPDAFIPELPNFSRGKVRENYDIPGDRRIIIATDRLSAFDIILASVPLKGQVLTQISRAWFEETADICPNHTIEYPDPNVVVARRLEILPVEIVVRGYLAGTTKTSILTRYRSGQRDLYGVRLADGLRANEELPQTLITPTTKAPSGGHDEPLSPAEILERGLLTAEQWNVVSSYAISLFKRGQERAAGRGLILVDTKYEFGIDRDGTIVLADELHTPDSSRYWVAETYEERVRQGKSPDSLDKDVIRSWVTSRCDPYRDPIPDIPLDVIEKTSQSYVRAYQLITGKRLTPDLSEEPPLARIRRNLESYY